MKKLFLSLVMTVLSVAVFAAGHSVSITHTNVLCYNGANGSATANVSGGVGPFTYSWTPTGATTQTITGLFAATYTVTVTDQSDMSTATASVSITQPTAVSISCPAFYTACNGACVTLSPVVTGGTPYYTFNWSSPMGLSSTVINNPISCPTTTTTYTVTVADANGCVATATTTVAVSNNLSATFTSSNVSACGACDGSVTATATGGAGVYTYQWMPGGITTAVVTGICAGNYSAVITDANGCTVTGSTTVLSSSINANFTMVPDSSNAYNFHAFNTTAGTGMSYSWDFGDGTTSTQVSPTHTFSAPGTYNVCLTAASALCNNTRCEAVTVTGTTNTCNALFNIATDTNSANPNAFTVYNLSYGANLTYLWNFGDGNTSSQANPTHIYSSNGNYQLCLTVDNGAGCTQTYCDSLLGVDSLSRSSNPLSLTVVNGPDFPGVVTGIENVNIENVISVFPNPFNDATTFVINSDKTNESYTFELYDVLGKKVMEQMNISSKQFQISRNGLESGVYFYKIYSSEIPINTGKLIIK